LKRKEAQGRSGAIATSSAFPPPPPFYGYYKDFLDDPDSAPLPPPPIEGTYTMFGANYTVRSSRACQILVSY
jgi:hypothetical protein